MDHSRQSKLLAPSDIPYPVIIIGAGGIGSWTALGLAKCGYPRITVWDDDLVEPANIPNQVYRPDQVGRPKVEALAEVIEVFSGTEIVTRPRRFGAEDQLRGITIVGVDSMASRRIVWSQAKRNPSVPLYVDARMARETGRIYTINPLQASEAEFYETTLYTDAEATPVPCGEQSIIHNVWVIAAMVSAQIKKYLKGGEIAQEILFDLNLNHWIFRSSTGQVLAIT